MYFTQFQQAMLAIGLFVWERRAHRDTSEDVRAELSTMKNDQKVVRWVFARVRHSLTV